MACCAVAAVASAACGGGASSGGTRGGADGGSTTVRVLQLNLCDSGIARCYTGRSVAAAAGAIRAERPGIVTLNEVCRDDVSVLRRALGDDARGGVLISAFEAVVQPLAGHRPVRCRNGQQYGVGLLVRVAPPYRGYTTHAGRYSSQDAADTEDRVWLCLHAIAHFFACTTHLASTSTTVAFSQCRYLMHTAIPALRRHYRGDPVIVGADLNLRDDRSPDPQSCLPPGFARTDDGGFQDIVASGPLEVDNSSTVDMRGTTDHPGLLVDLRASPRHRP